MGDVEEEGETEVEDGGGRSEAEDRHILIRVLTSYRPPHFSGLLLRISLN
jgi:hypothetical protein